MKCFRELTLVSRTMKMQISVMPAWIAIQVRRMRPETSMSAWIPALHAEIPKRGMVNDPVPRLAYVRGEKRYGYGPTTTLFSAVSLIGPAGDLLMIPRICECGRTLIMKSNKRWSRHGYRRIKGHDLCRKCNASLRDKVLSSLQNERWRRVNLNLTEPSRENCGAAHATF